MAEFIPDDYNFEVCSANKSEVHPEETIKFKIFFYQHVTSTSPNISKIGFRLRLEDTLYGDGQAAPLVYLEENIPAEHIVPLDIEFTTYDIDTYNVADPIPGATIQPVIHNDFYGYTDSYPRRLYIELFYLESASDNITYNYADPITVNTYIYAVVSKHTYLSIEPTYQQIIVGSKNCQENETGQLRINEDWQVTGLFPIGTIHMSTDSRNPSEYFGGQWEPFAQGRVLVCVDTTDEELNAPLMTGGEKTHQLTINEMPSHRHRNYFVSSAIQSGTDYARPTAYDSSGTASIATNYVGEGQAHNNLQPYITCYMWLRVG